MDIYVGMRRRIVLCVLIGCLGALTACSGGAKNNTTSAAGGVASAQQSPQGGQGTQTSPNPNPNPTVDPSAVAGRRVVPSGSPGVACVDSGTQATLTDADNGANVCLVTGGQLKLTLTGTGWTQPVVSGSALKADPTFAKGAFLFTAAKKGTVTVTSSRPACPTSKPGTVTCHAIQAFRISVTVA